MMHCTVPDDDRRLLIQPLQRLIERGGVKQVYFSDTSLPPPPEAINLSRCRYSITLSGNRRMRVANRGTIIDQSLPAGTALFAPPRGWTLPLFPNDCTTLGTVFHATHTRVLHNPRRRRERRGYSPAYWYHIQHPHPTTMRDTLNAVQHIAETHGDRETARHLINALLRMVLEELVQDDEVAGRAHRTWQHVMDFLEENCHRPLNRNEVAREMRLHPNYLSRLFREQAGETFVACLTRLRLELAEHLLRDPRLSVGEVAARSGFGDAGHFIKVFRKRFGKSPGRYRS